jgi:hypothetical protein
MKSIALVALAACGATTDAPVKPDLREQVKAAHARMHGRFEASGRMQIAIGVGDLARAQVEAREIVARTEPDFLPEWQAYADEISTAAHAVAATTDTVSAAKATGTLGAACGRCHLAMSAKLVFAVELPPVQPSNPRLASQMATHQWAASRMWEGLVAPDDARWLQGARALGESRIAITAGGPESDVSQIHLLAARAQQPGGIHERGALYGELLGACAHCHFVIRDGTRRP